MQEIIFSEHAEIQIKERKISRISVLETVNRPDAVYDQENKRKRAMRCFNAKGKKYLFIVIFEEDINLKLIITVFITSKIKKYL